MKAMCNIIKDLLVMYREDEVSEDTKEFVEEHLKECEECRGYYEQMNKSIDAVEELKSEKIEEDKENRIFKKSFRKIRKRWIASIVCVVLIVPLSGFAGRLTKNQIEGRGLSFTNIDEVMLCKKYLKEIKNKDFNAVYDMMNVAMGLNHIKCEYNFYSNEEGIKKLTHVRLNEEEWCMSNSMTEDISYDENNEQVFWENVINGYIPKVLIPEEIWNSIVTNPYIIETEWFGAKLKYYYTSKDKAPEECDVEPYANQGFVYLQTKWGNYYTYGESSYTIDGKEVYCIGAEDILKAGNDAVELYSYMEIFPKEIAEEAEIDIKKESADSLEYIKTEYGNILNMTDEEYREYIKSEYEEAFNNFWNRGYAITDISYIDKDQNVKIMEYDETVVMHMEFEDKNGNKESGKLTLGVKNGEIVIYSFESNCYVLEKIIEEIINII